jgi:hypothetical protein
MDKKIQTLEAVINKVEQLYNSYNPKEYSSPDYEIPEEITTSLKPNVPNKEWSKLLNVIRYVWDDSIKNLYLNDINNDWVTADITKSELEEMFQLILNK